MCNGVAWPTRVVWPDAGVLELSAAMMEVKRRQRLAASDAVAARRRLQEEAGAVEVLPPEARPS